MPDNNEKSLMKNSLGKQAAERIAQTLKPILPGFSPSRFVRQATDGIEPLELKERLRHFIDVLSRHLPADFNRAADVLAQIPGTWVRGKSGDSLQGFAAWPLIDYVPHRGMEYPERALDLLHDLTPLFSAEFAVRPFLKRHFSPTYNRMLDWCRDPDHHVRRLASEGSRPRLPWGERLPQFIADPEPGLVLLELLKDDPSEYVRRSVANHLNDISKDHPKLVVDRCLHWLKDASPERAWIVRHGTRTLVKAGLPEVFPLLGFAEKPQIAVRDFVTDRSTLRFGDTLRFAFTVESRSRVEQRLVLDYGIHFMKANGTLNRKVFKLKQVTLRPGESIRVEKAHAVRPITTRRYYPGEHRIELLVNGTSYAEAPFLLEMKPGEV